MQIILRFAQNDGILISMSKKLVKAMKDVVLREGQTGKGRLADTIGRKIRIIEHYIEGSHTPNPSNAYKLAVACGLGEEEALAVARECSPEGQQTA